MFFILSVIQIVVTLFIKTDIRIEEKQKYSFKKFIEYIRNNKLEKLQKI